MAVKDKKIWILLIFILAGIVIGGLLNELAIRMGAPTWLTTWYPFGLEDPLSVNFQIVKFSFAFLININIFSIIGMLIGIFVYRKV